MSEKHYRLGIIGYPLGHTLSPVLHHFFLGKSGLKGHYETVSVLSEALPNWLAQAKALREWDGFNVTIPHKIAVMPAMDILSDAAQIIGAVNTVHCRDGQWFGENTDWQGFIAPLSVSQRESIQSRPVLVLGAGGASLAVFYGLLHLGCPEILIWARNPEKALAMVSQVQSMAASMGQSANVRAFSETTALSPIPLAMVVNTTPVGMTGGDTGPLWVEAVFNQVPPDCLVYDLVYNPLKTNLIVSAEQCHLPTQTGLAMLIHQGAVAFTLWTEHRLEASILVEAQQFVCPQE